MNIFVGVALSVTIACTFAARVIDNWDSDTAGTEYPVPADIYFPNYHEIQMERCSDIAFTPCFEEMDPPCCKGLVCFDFSETRSGGFDGHACVGANKDEGGADVVYK